MLTWTEESEREVVRAMEPVAGLGYMGRSEPHGWRVRAGCPADWAQSIQACQGSFFHTPLGLRLGGSGESCYVTRSGESRVPAIAALVFHRCRLSAAPRHVRMATMPGVAAGGDGTEALVEIREWLRASGVAEMVVESFDAESNPDPALGGSRIERIEFVVPTGSDDMEALARCLRHHRRYIGAGERQGWAFRFLAGRDAEAAIAEVTRAASTRADRRGDGFTPPTLPVELFASGAAGDAWGTFTAAAYADDTLLAAALVGWGGRSAFYTVGGSTAEGYARSAAPWLHWRVLRALRTRGIRQYNLGGVPASAQDTADPSYGLYRFKTGFGAESRARSSVRWILAPRHTRVHAAAKWIAARIGGS